MARRGRPALNDAGVCGQISVRLSPEAHDAVVALKAENVSIPSLVRRLLIEAAAKRKIAPPESALEADSAWAACPGCGERVIAEAILGSAYAVMATCGGCGKEASYRKGIGGVEAVALEASTAN